MHMYVIILSEQAEKNMQIYKEFSSIIITIAIKYLFYNGVTFCLVT